MSFVSIDLDPETIGALKTAATATGVTLERYVTTLVTDAVCARPPLPPEGHMALSLLRDLRARPARPVAIADLHARWATRHACVDLDILQAGLSQLQAAGLLEPTTSAASAIVLTERGYRF